EGIKGPYQRVDFVLLAGFHNRQRREGMAVQTLLYFAGQQADAPVQQVVHYVTQQQGQKQQTEQLRGHAGGGGVDCLLQQQFVVKGDFQHTDVFIVERQG